MKMNIIELHAQFCQEALVIKNYRPSTIKYYKKTLEYFLRNSHIEYLEQFTTENIRMFLYNGRIERHWSSETFLTHHKSLRAFLKWCVGRGYLKDNPILPIERPRLEKKLPKRITKQEAQKVLEYSFHRKSAYRFERYRNRGVIAMMIYAGLRASEVFNLKLHDVDLKNNVIAINLGKGGKDRIVPICLPLQRILIEYLKDRDRLNRKCLNFFTSTHGDIPFTYNGLKKVVEVLRR